MSLNLAEYFEAKIAGKTDKSIRHAYKVKKSTFKNKKAEWGFEGYTRDDFSALKKRIKQGQKHYKGRRYV